MTGVTTVGPQPYDISVKDDANGSLQFRGRKLGEGSSYSHGKRRWLEVEIFRRETDNAFVISIIGKSSMPNEVDRVRVVETLSAFEVVEVLTVTHDGKTYIPRDSSRALAQAAQWDEDIRDAYVNRAV